MCSELLRQLTPHAEILQAFVFFYDGTATQCALLCLHLSWNTIVDFNAFRLFNFRFLRSSTFSI